MFVNEYDFGKTTDGKVVKKITIGNGGDIEFSVINRGATLQSFKITDRNGILEDCILGFDTIGEYEEHKKYYGATIGRVANRIADGTFTLDGTKYDLAKNNIDINCLHGGKKGFDKVMWAYETFQSETAAGVSLTYISEDGDESFPGNLSVDVKFTLTDNNEFIIGYTAETDKATPVNLTNHAYWNLSGFKENIHSHTLEMGADDYLPTNKNQIPTGEFKSVSGTPYDFRKSTILGNALEQTGGFNHNFNLTHKKQIAPINKVLLIHPGSGRSMEIKTTEPGLQIFTGFEKHEAICLETQMYPNAVNQEGFESDIIKPGEMYKHVTIHSFTKI